MSTFNYSLSKKDGDPVFTVKGGKDSGVKFKITDSVKGTPVKEYENSNKLIPIPGKGRLAEFVFGSSGSGKSTYAAELVRSYKRKYPNNPFYLISPKRDDETINKLNPNRIEISFDNFLGDDPITLEEVEDSIVLFDDTEAISDEKLRKAVDSFRDQILVRGRSMEISCIAIMHLAMSGWSTRILIAEAKRIVVFPHAGQINQITNLLKMYVGLSKDQITEVLKQPSRYVIVNKVAPIYYMTEHKFKLLV